MYLSRRSFVRALSGVAAAAMLPFPLQALASSDGPVVKCRLGSLKGSVVSGVHVFRGVPCGKNPYVGA